MLYSDDNDAVFYKVNTSPQEMTIGDGHFAVFFPQDGHMPQLFVGKLVNVKKW